MPWVPGKKDLFLFDFFSYIQILLLYVKVINALSAIFKAFTLLLSLFWLVVFRKSKKVEIYVIYFLYRKRGGIYFTCYTEAKIFAFLKSMEKWWLKPRFSVEILMTTDLNILEMFYNVFQVQSGPFSHLNRNVFFIPPSRFFKKAY